MKSIILLGCLMALSGSAGGLQSPELLPNFNAASVLARQSMSATPTDLVSSVAKNPVVADSPSVCRLRKNGGAISFQGTVFLGERGERTGYGYCLR